MKFGLSGRQDIGTAGTSARQKRVLTGFFFDFFCRRLYGFSVRQWTLAPAKIDALEPFESPSVRIRSAKYAYFSPDFRLYLNLVLGHTWYFPVYMCMYFKTNGL